MESANQPATISKNTSPRRRPGLSTVVLLLLVLAPLAVLAYYDLYLPTRPAPVHAPRTLKHTDLNPYGANFFLHLEAEQWKVEKTLEMAANAGIGWVKQQFPWESLEKSSGRYWDDRYNISTWDKFDFIVDTALKYDMQVIARLDRPPDWARAEGSSPMSPPRDLADYGRFVGQVAKHYKGKVRYYQIWNEPNLTEEWGNGKVDARAYTELLKVAYQAIKEADPNAYVLSAPLAQTLEANEYHLNEVDYLRGMYEAGAKPYFDILFANAYGFSLPPDDPAAADRLNFARVLLQRQLMVEFDDAEKPVWFNEFGWNSAPASMSPVDLKWGRVDEPKQAEYTAAAVRQARAEWPWAGVFNLWFFRQDGHISPQDAQYYFRMVDVGFTPRLVYAAIAEEAKAGLIAGPGPYEPTHPAIVSDNSWFFEASDDVPGGEVLTGGAAGGKVLITINGGGLDLLTNTSPQGGRLYVKVDGNGADNLPSDADGSHYIDLYSEQPVTMARIPLLRDLRDGVHKIELTLARERDPRSSGNVAQLGGFEVYQGTHLPLRFLAYLGLSTVVALYLAVRGWQRHRWSHAA